MSVISKWLVTDSEQVHDIDAVYEFSCLRLVKSCWTPPPPAPTCMLPGRGNIGKKNGDPGTLNSSLELMENSSRAVFKWVIRA